MAEVDILRKVMDTFSITDEEFYKSLKLNTANMCCKEKYSFAYTMCLMKREGVRI